MQARVNCASLRVKRRKGMTQEKSTTPTQCSAGPRLTLGRHKAQGGGLGEGDGTYPRAKAELFLPKAKARDDARATEARSGPQHNVMMLLLYQVELEGGLLNTNCLVCLMHL